MLLRTSKTTARQLDDTVAAAPLKRLRRDSILSFTGLMTQISHMIVSSLFDYETILVCLIGFPVVIS